MGSILSAVTGLCAGIVSGTALCAFLVALGVFSKTIQSLGIMNRGALAAVSSAVGGVAGTAITIFNINIVIGEVYGAVFGLFGGIYVGVVIACLAEVTNAIPIIKNHGMSRPIIQVLLTGFVLGKAVGSIVYWLSRIY